MKRPEVLLPALFLLLGACGGPPDPGPGASADDSPFLLAQDLPDAVGVREAKAGEEGKPVRVVGRVRHLAKGVFHLVDDQAVAYCGRTCMDDCPTPWDYCCESPAKVLESTLVVEVRDAGGAPVTPERMGLRPLDLVALEGTLAREEGGVVVLRAGDGWFRRERVAFGPHVRLP